MKYICNIIFFLTFGKVCLGKCKVCKKSCETAETAETTES